MKRIQTIILFCLVICISSPVLSADNNQTKIYFYRGKDNLEKGMFNLNEFKKALNTGFAQKRIKVGGTRRKFEEDRIELSLFLKEVQSPYTDHYIGLRCWSEIGEVFQDAGKEFEEAIRLDSSLIDAYLCRAASLIEMGDYEKAFPVFCEAIESLTQTDGKVDIKKIRFVDPFWEIIEDLFYGITDEVMKGRLEPPQGKKYELWATEMIALFKGWREDWQEKKIGDLSRQIEQEENSEKRKELEEEKKIEITQKVQNSFELARFYVRHHKKDEAGEEYKKIKDDLSKRGYQLWRYPGIVSEIEKGYENLEKLDFVMNPDLIKEFGTTTKIRFFNDEDHLTCDSFYFYFLPSGCEIEFKDEVSYKYMMGTTTLYCIGNTSPTCEIMLPQIEIKEKDKLPFCITVDGEVLSSPACLELLFEKKIRKYPSIGQTYEWKRDGDNEWTIIQLKKIGDKDEYTNEKFEKGEKFTSTITINQFAGKELEIRKTGKWQPIEEGQRKLDIFIKIMQIVCWWKLK